MRYLSIVEILELHDSIISSSGGARGIRDIESIESAVNQSRLTFDRIDLYPDVVSKAAAICFSLERERWFQNDLWLNKSVQNGLVQNVSIRAMRFHEI